MKSFSKMFLYLLIFTAIYISNTVSSKPFCAQTGCTMIYVSQFGAAGDGQTDDTAAIQAALSATKNDPSIVVFEKNHTYLLQKEVYLYSNTIINLNGSTICNGNGENVNDEYVQWGNGLRFLNNPDCVSLAGYGALKNVSIYNGTIDGSNVAGISGVSFTLLHAYNVSFDNIEFRDCMAGTHIIDLGGCKNVTIKNCNFTGSYISVKKWRYREMIQIDSAVRKGMPYWERVSNVAYDSLPCENITITNCNFERGNGTHAPNAIGTHTAYANASKNILITNNTFRDCYSYAIRFPKVTKLTIRNNHFISQNRTHKSTSAFIKLYSAKDSNNSYSQCKSINITNNIFQSKKKTNCIIPVSITGHATKPFTNITIQKNQLKGGYLSQKKSFLWQCKKVTNCKIK